jgi:hypothetical protein
MLGRPKAPPQIRGSIRQFYRWHEMPSGDYSGSSSDIDGLGYVIVAGRRLPHRREWPSLKCVKIRRADFTRVPAEP